MLIILVLLCCLLPVWSFKPGGTLNHHFGRRHLAPLGMQDGEKETVSLLISKQFSESKNAKVMDEDAAKGDNNYGNAETDTLTLLLQASLIGASTGGAVVLFKSSIQVVQKLLYEDLADLLPKPAFYWPIVLYPVIGATLVSVLSTAYGKRMNNNLNTIASKLRVSNRDNFTDAEAKLELDDVWQGAKDNFARTFAAIATLGSGCSLGPEGPAVEIGARISSVVGRRGRRKQSSIQNMRELFLSGAAAGVGAGFNAPIAGIFFAIECGTKYLTEERDVDVTSVESEGGVSTWMGAPGENGRGTSARRGTDIAAMVIAATVADLVVGLGLHESQALSVQGNLFAMQSPAFELALYIGLGLVSGAVALGFDQLRDRVSALFRDSSPLSDIPPAQRPILAGILCGVFALYLPQTLFVGYATLDDILAGKIHPAIPLSMALLASKMFLSAFSLESGLVGGVFAPSLFFGAVLGNLYHDISSWLLHGLQDLSVAVFPPAEMHSTLSDAISHLKLANAPAYATVGAASVLSAIFRAPLTSSILMLELTENHDIVVPLLVAAATSTQATYLWSSREKKKQ